MNFDLRSSAIPYLIALFTISLLLVACAGPVAVGSPQSAGTNLSNNKVKTTLVISLQGNIPDNGIGAIDLTLEAPPGVSVQTLANGALADGVVKSSLTGSSVIVFGKFINSVLRVAFVSPA